MPGPRPPGCGAGRQRCSALRGTTPRPPPRPGPRPPWARGRREPPTSVRPVRARRWAGGAAPRPYSGGRHPRACARRGPAPGPRPDGAAPARPLGPGGSGAAPAWRGAGGGARRGGGGGSGGGRGWAQPGRALVLPDYLKRAGEASWAFLAAPKYRQSLPSPPQRPAPSEAQAAPQQQPGALPDPRSAAAGTARFEFGLHLHSHDDSTRTGIGQALVCPPQRSAELGRPGGPSRLPHRRSPAVPRAGTASPEPVWHCESASRRISCIHSRLLHASARPSALHGQRMSSRLSSDLPTQRHAGTARRGVAVLPPCDSGGNGAPGAAAVEPHNDTVRSEHGQSPAAALPGVLLAWVDVFIFYSRSGNIFNICVLKYTCILERKTFFYWLSVPEK